MTPKEYDTKPAIEHLRLLVRNFDGMNETFNQRFTITQLIALHRAWMLSDWDICPDEWEERQVWEALKGRPPTFDHNERPTYDREEIADERSHSDVYSGTE